MKRLLITSCFMLFAGLATFAQAVIKFDKNSHNFGTFTEDKPVSFVFNFTNIGDKPLVIQQAFTSCGCTVADYTKTEIQPKQKGQVTVTYNGKGKAPGYFRKVVTVRSNASNSLTRVYVEGNMTPKE